MIRPYVYESLSLGSRGEFIEVPGFGRVQVEDVYGSYNRKVFFARLMDGTNTRWVFKNFPFQSQPKEESLQDAQGAQKNIEFYWGRLREVGVPVVSEMGFTYLSQSNATILIQYEPWAGITSSVAIKSLRDELVLEMVTQMLEQVAKPLFLNASIGGEEKSERLNLGFDFIPRNVTYEVNDGGYIFTYVDVFPWKYRLACGQYALEYPEPTDETVRLLGLFRSYNMVGILVNFWAHLVSLRPELAKDFYFLIESFIRRNNLNQLYDLEVKITDYLLGHDLSAGELPTIEVTKLIQNWTFEDIFRIRLFACALATARPQARKHLKRLFELTHFQNTSLSDDAMREIKQSVFEMAACPIQVK